jgi:hypothetical protein
MDQLYAIQTNNEYIAQQIIFFGRKVGNSRSSETSTRSPTWELHKSRHEDTVDMFTFFFCEDMILNISIYF